MIRAFPVLLAVTLHSIFAFSDPFPFDRSRSDICSDVASGKVIPDSINIKSGPFNAKGDGTSNDYNAFIRLANRISGSRTSPKNSPLLVIIPSGNYLLNAHKIACPTASGSGANGVTDVIFQNFSNVRIVGCGQATVRVKGDFNRTMDYGVITLPDGTRFGQSCENSVTPFFFRFASHFALEGLSIDGSVNQTTRENVNEGGSNGVVTGAVSDARFSDLEVHHFGTDGIYVGQGKLPGLSVGQADRNLTFERLNLHHNARQGMTVVQARGVMVKDSMFANSGRTETSRYPGFPPMAGVDVEPNYSPFFGSYPMDVTTGDITFENCQFRYNLGPQFSAQTGADHVDRSILENVRIVGRRSPCEQTSDNPEECPSFNRNRSGVVTSPDSHPNAVILSVPGGLLDKVRIQAHANALYAYWGGAWNAKKKPSTKINDTFIIASGMGSALVDRANHDFEMTRSRVYVNVPNSQVPIDIKNERATLSNNRFFFNGTGIGSGSPPINMASFLAKEMKGNRYYFNSVNDPDSGVQINYSPGTQFTREVFYNGPFRIARETSYDIFSLAGLTLEGARSFFQGFGR